MSSEHQTYLVKLKRGKMFVKLMQVLIFVSIFAAWEVAARLELIDPFIFSQPSRILKAIIKMSSDGSLFLHIGVTMAETVVGFALSMLLGLAISVVLWWNGTVNRVLNPYLVVLNSLPKTALAPIIIVWVGNNVKSVIVTALLTSIIVTVLTIHGGFAEVSADKIKLVRSFGGSKKQILFKVVLPSSVPAIISSLKINVGLSFVGVIVGEFLVARAGLGYLIVYGSQIFKMDWVMMSVTILCLLAALMYRFVVVLEKRICLGRGN